MKQNKNLKKTWTFFEPTNMNSYCCKEYYDAYKKGDYCFYCGIIYRDLKGNETNNDDKSWLSQLSNNDNFKYIFPICRIKNQNKKRNKKSKFKV